MASLLLPSCGFSQKHLPSAACPIPRQRLQRGSPILLLGWRARTEPRITVASVVCRVSSSSSASSYPTSSASSAGSVVFRDLDADDFRHPLDKQNTLLLRAIPGLNEFGKALLGNDNNL
ncbi:hypothetical protein Taro_052349 [Colocasia esculenta]|uniref:Uncharacterized protein n=1 Tax=Colocasia esculenta TaxID=4460 RepID=A0A843XJZ0_COLES|nr:hypothetical protein [Colocasia esculenta]